MHRNTSTGQFYYTCTIIWRLGCIDSATTTVAQSHLYPVHRNTSVGPAHINPVPWTRERVGQSYFFSSLPCSPIQAPCSLLLLFISSVNILILTAEDTAVWAPVVKKSKIQTSSVLCSELLFCMYGINLAFLPLFPF